MACAFTHDIFEMIAMMAEVRTPCVGGVIRLPLASLRRRQPDTGMVTKVFGRASGVVGGALLWSMLPRHYEPTGSRPSAPWVNGTLQPAYRRRSQKVGQSGRAEALSASSEPFHSSFVCILGPLSRAASVHGPYLEHVVRAGSTLAAAQRSRPCSTILACNA